MGFFKIFGSKEQSYTHERELLNNFGIAESTIDKLISRNDGSLELMLGNMFRKSGDMTKSAEYYQKGAGFKNLNSCYNLGLCYLRGEGVSQDSQKAIDNFIPPAEAGSVDAMFCIGHTYLFGVGITKNYEKGVMWLQKAADNGDSQSQEMLANSAFLMIQKNS